ncbi:MAG: hemerythrin domain-containing protein, partial [Proteobacteria bacterium]
MEIFETLRKDHALVRDQLDLLIGLTAEKGGGDEWIEAFYDLKMALVAHNRAEESVFYDVMNRVPN